MGSLLGSSMKHPSLSDGAFLSLVAFVGSLAIQFESFRRSCESGCDFLFFGGISFSATCSQMRFHISALSAVAPLSS